VALAPVSRVNTPTCRHAFEAPDASPISQRISTYGKIDGAPPTGLRRFYFATGR
jgi:hypothetical protein